MELSSVTLELSEIACFTGHRPDRLFGTFNPDADTVRRCKTAIGYLVEQAIILDQFPLTRLIAAVPFLGQEFKWPKQAQRHYQALLGRATHVVYVNDPGYAAWKLFERDKWMVHRSSLVIAAVDGIKRGGTRHTIEHAEALNRRVRRINPQVFL